MSSQSAAQPTGTQRSTGVSSTSAQQGGSQPPQDEPASEFAQLIQQITSESTPQMPTAAKTTLIQGQLSKLPQLVHPEPLVVSLKPAPRLDTLEPVRQPAAKTVKAAASGSTAHSQSPATSGTTGNLETTLPEDQIYQLAQFTPAVQQGSIDSAAPFPATTKGSRTPAVQPNAVTTSDPSPVDSPGFPTRRGGDGTRHPPREPRVVSRRRAPLKATDNSTQSGILVVPQVPAPPPLKLKLPTFGTHEGETAEALPRVEPAVRHVPPVKQDSIPEIGPPPALE